MVTRVARALYHLQLTKKAVYLDSKAILVGPGSSHRCSLIIIPPTGNTALALIEPLCSLLRLVLLYVEGYIYLLLGSILVACLVILIIG